MAGVKVEVPTGLVPWKYIVPSPPLVADITSLPQKVLPPSTAVTVVVTGAPNTVYTPVDADVALQPVPSHVRATLYAPVPAAGLNVGEILEEPVTVVIPGPDHV